MTSNPFSEYPFWHYYTLHMQNSIYIDDQFRGIDLGPLPIPLVSLLNGDTTSLKVSFDQEDREKLLSVIKNSMFYDFVNDRIVRGSDLDQTKVYLITSKSFNPNTIKTLPSDAILILKGIRNPETRVGGEIVPMIASPNNMLILFYALSNALDIAKGKTGSDGKPPTPYNTLANLNQSDRDRLLRLLKRDVYQNPTIESILQSYKKQSTSSSYDIERVVPKIRNQLNKIIPEEKAINVASGSLVNATAPCYNVYEKQVTNTTTNEQRIVKFAFRVNMNDEIRQAYNRLLIERFKAQDVQSTQVSSEQRRAIALNPVRASYKDYENLFKSNEGFQSYIRKINEATSSQMIDVSQSLHDQIDNSLEDEEIEDNYFDDEEDDLQDY